MGAAPHRGQNRRFIILVPLPPPISAADSPALELRPLRLRKGKSSRVGARARFKCPRHFIHTHTGTTYYTRAHAPMHHLSEEACARLMLSVPPDLTSRTLQRRIEAAEASSTRRQRQLRYGGAGGADSLRGAKRPRAAGASTPGSRGVARDSGNGTNTTSNDDDDNNNGDNDGGDEQARGRKCAHRGATQRTEDEAYLEMGRAARSAHCTPRDVFLRAARQVLLPLQKQQQRPSASGAVGAIPSSIYRRYRSQPRDALSFGCARLDSVLRVRAGALTEICGESSSGKTQLLLQLAAHNPDHTLYINTEGGRFPSQRLLEVAPAGTGASEAARRDVLARVLVDSRPPCTPEELSVFARRRLPALLQRNGNGNGRGGVRIRLVIIDSIAAAVRAEYGAGRRDMMQRA